jgi:hypothetical protein
MNLAYRAAPDRRFGLLLTVLVHMALVIGWQAVRTLPAPSSMEDSPRSRLLWIPLPRPSLRPAPRDKAPEAPRKEAAPPRPQTQAAPAIVPLPITPTAAPTTAPAGEATPAPAANAAPPAPPSDAKPSAQQILERAKRDVGSIAKALRKENNPYIAAPLDSPQMRLRQGIEHANAMAPNRIWEAPKVEELVNNTGDGARRTRVITGNGTYCITERATNTDVEMIEHHGKIRRTNCPTPEEPAKQQAWRTLRD